MHNLSSIKGARLSIGSFVPAAANSNKALLMTEEEEMKISAYAARYQGVTQVATIGDTNRVDVFITPQEKAMGLPAMSISKFSIDSNSDTVSYNLFVRKSNSNIPSSEFESTLDTLRRFLYSNYTPAVQQITLNSG